MNGLILLSLLAASRGEAAEPQGIRPQPQEPECHSMMGKCPAGWHSKDPKAAASETGWIECCQDAGEFVPLPPQPHEKYPICNPKTRGEWLAVGIEFEEGCDLRYSTCAIKYRPEGQELEPAPPPREPGHGPAKKAPAAKPAEAAPLPSAGLQRRRAEDGQADPAAPLISALKAKTAAERERAALNLAALGQRAASALSALGPLAAKDPSPRVRACAVLAAASVARTKGAALPLVRKALSDRDPRVRAVAAQALKALGDD